MIKRTNQVRVEEVKRMSALNNLGKIFFKLENQSNPQRFEDYYLKKKEELERVGGEDLDKRVGDPVFLNRFDRMAWTIEQVPFEYMGPWPKMHGLPIELTIGNVLDVAQEIRSAKEEGRVISFNSFRELKDCQDISKVPKRLIDKIDGIISRHEFILDNFLPILIPGGVERDSWWNLAIGQNGRPRCKIFPYDIQDGNARCVTAALLDRTSTLAYCGHFNGNIKQIYEQEKIIRGID